MSQQVYVSVYVEKPAGQRIALAVDNMTINISKKGDLVKETGKIMQEVREKYPDHDYHIAVRKEKYNNN